MTTTLEATAPTWNASTAAPGVFHCYLTDKVTLTVDDWGKFCDWFVSINGVIFCDNHGTCYGSNALAEAKQAAIEAGKETMKEFGYDY